MKALSNSFFVLLGCASLVLSNCKDDDKETVLPGAKTYQMDAGWNCDGVNCQDVYELKFVKDSKVTFSITEVGGASMAQIALYRVGVNTGGVNLFTATENELACFVEGSCENLQ